MQYFMLIKFYVYSVNLSIILLFFLYILCYYNDILRIEVLLWLKNFSTIEYITPKGPLLI